MTATIHTRDELRTCFDGGDLLDPDRRIGDTHLELVGVEPSATGQSQGESQSTAAGSSPSADSQCRSETQTATVVSESILQARAADDLLAIMADAVDDLERVRIAMENRYRALTSDYIEGENGGRFGKGFPDTAPEAQRFASIIGPLKQLEHQAVLELGRSLRAHPLGPWIKGTPGLGEKQAGRLLAAIGDPYWNDLHYRPRTVSELWAYSGYHVLDGTAAKRAKGVKSNWSTIAKTRAYLCAESAVKAGVRKLDDCDDTEGYDTEHRHAITRYGQKYLDRRTHTAVSQPEWTAGHRHNDALRIVAKQILKDLWCAARDLAHDQHVSDAQCARAVIHELPADRDTHGPHLRVVGGHPFHPDQRVSDTQGSHVGVES